ncbi:MAG: hypothetical protein ACFFCW_46360 [Candidatus Hodarchaeota archaeon]
MYNTIAIESYVIPSVAIINAAFMKDTKSAASGRGMPGVRYVTHTIPPECTVKQDIESGVEEIIDEVVAALTKPLSEEEEFSKKKTEKTRRIIFKGDLEGVNRFYYEKGWADGLPIVPPTEEFVSEMLQGTDLPPDHVVAKIIPRLGKATIEKIAINAVMAGCLPTHIPVLIAGVKAIMDLETSGFGVIEVSTGSWTPCWIINGPIRKDININYKTGAFSPGDLANAAIGRAMGLIIQNIGGARKGIEDMGTLGNPMKHSMVIGEDEEGSPWDPLHVERGFRKEDSAVTVFFPNTYIQIWPYGTNAKGVLQATVYNIPPARTGTFCLLLNEGHAKSLAREGWTKKEIKDFIVEFARCPGYKHFYKYWSRQKELIPPTDMDQVSLFETPDHIIVMVGGGVGNWMGLILGSRPQITEGVFVTKKVKLPKNWQELVTKYRNVVPKYSFY